MGSKRHLIFVWKKSFEKVLRVARGRDRGKFFKRLADFPPSPIVCKLQCFLHDFQKLALKMWSKFAAKMAPRWCQEGAKMARRRLFLALSWLILVFFGAMVAHLRLHMPPRWPCAKWVAVHLVETRGRTCPMSSRPCQFRHAPTFGRWCAERLAAYNAGTMHPTGAPATNRQRSHGAA